MNRIQDRYWAADLAATPLVVDEHFDPRRVRCFSPRPLTLPAMFADLVRRFPEHPAIAEERHFTYAELDRTAAAIASGLLSNGIAAEDART